MPDQTIAYAQDHQQQFLDSLFALLRIPSISTQTIHAQDIASAADYLVTHLKSIGLEHVQAITTPGHPIVYADWLKAAGKPTVLIYGHYDVQPPDPLAQWSTPPFEPTVKDNRLYGRGTSDNKCQHFIHLAAIASFLNTTKALPVNVKLVIEGEEESESVNFRQTLENDLAKFAHDVSIIADVGMADIHTPAIIYGLRGILYTEITVTGPNRDLHSGVYGGAIDNPALVLARLLSLLKDSHNRITLPDFYDSVEEISQTEKNLLRHAARSDTQILKDIGVATLIAEPGLTAVEQRKVRPAVDVHGLLSGYTDEGAKTIIPATATAKVSFRLVPHQDPDTVYQQLDKFLHTHLPPSVKLTITKFGGSRAVVTDVNNQAIALTKQALAKTFNKEPILDRSGGSIPAATHLQDLFHQPVIMTGFTPPDDNIHAPNENFYLPNFIKGIEATIRLYSNLSQLS